MADNENADKKAEKKSKKSVKTKGDPVVEIVNK